MKISIIIVLLFIRLLLIGQESFSKYYSFDSYGSTIRSMLIERDTILLQGYFIDTVSPFLQGIVFAKVDSFGNLLTYHRYFDSKGRDLSYNPLNNIIRLSDGRFLTLSMALQDNALQLWFLTSDFQLDTVFEFFSGDQSVQLNWWRNVYEVSDGYLVFGSAQRLNFNDDIQIIKVSKNGELMWRKWLGLSNKDEVSGDVAKYSDSTFVVASFRKPFPVPAADLRKNTWIFEVDTNGNILHEFLDTDPFSGGSGGLVFDKDRNIYFSGTSIVEDIFGNDNTLGRISRLNSEFKFQWKRTFGKNFNPMNGLGDMILLDNHLIASGTNVDSSRNSWGSPSGYTGGWLVMTSLNGDSICERIDTAQWFPIDGTGMGLFRAIDTLSSGSIITCGDGRFGPNENNYHDYAWLVKTTNPPCEGLKVGNTEIRNKIQIWGMSPNPAKKSTLIQLNQIDFNETTIFCLFDTNGRIVKRTFADFGVDHVIFDLRNLAEGLYIVQSFNKKGHLTGIEKLIIIK